MTALPAALENAISFNDQGLVMAIAQQHDSGEILMVAWMNHDSLAETLETRQVCYWSRSRRTLWRKGESSGQTQKLIDLQVDCDGDALLLRVDQKGVACHTGRRSCFYRSLDKDGGLEETLPVVTDPTKLYGA